MELTHLFTLIYTYALKPEELVFTFSLQKKKKTKQNKNTRETKKLRQLPRFASY